MIPVAGDKKQFFLENLDETHRENITMPPGCHPAALENGVLRRWF